MRHRIEYLIFLLTIVVMLITACDKKVQEPPAPEIETETSQLEQTDSNDIPVVKINPTEKEKVDPVESAEKSLTDSYNGLPTAFPRM